MTPRTLASPVPSPCVDVCSMDAATGWCTGCLRTMDEIAMWSRLDDELKRGVWARLDGRRDEWQRLRAIEAVKP